VRTSAEVLARASRVRLLVLDVDGVLTDGRLYYGPSGEALKVFDVKDGHGLVLVREVIELAVISARPGEISRRRMEELGVKHIHFDRRDKLVCYETLIRELGCPDDQVAFMGDDVNDLPLLQRVGLATAPADALPEVRSAAHWVASAPGGRGAVRELCDLLLRARAAPG
jgi:3-deoxy-D-manno-octulosonate 8-phosphate phosphatase (KDO 8-P phosphatase)